MKPYWKQDNNTIYQGHILDILKEMPPESVQMVVTSPPYWGLRDYGLPPMVWDEKRLGHCRQIINNRETYVKDGHEWGDEIKKRNRGSCGDKSTLDGGDMIPNIENTQGQFCQVCNAWRGSLGLEPTPELFIDHIVQIFREIRRVLRKDGTVWLNLGDSYASSGSGFGQDNSEKSNGGACEGFRDAKYLNQKNPKTAVSGLKPKDLIGIPWRVALALQADGWWLRSDIIWHKPNPMPESVTDRPTKAHEYLFLLTKSPKYYYDNEAIRESAQDWGNRDRTNWSARINAESYGQKPHTGGENGNYAKSGRNKRTVWTIATQPMPDAHFATFPEKLVEPCILAGTSEKGCCVECGAPWERVVEKSGGTIGKSWHDHSNDLGAGMSQKMPGLSDMDIQKTYKVKTIGWKPTCKCMKTLPYPKPVPCTVFDPFFGSGTSGIVAHRHGHNFVGIELSEAYLKDIAIPRIEKETKQRGLFK